MFAMYVQIHAVAVRVEHPALSLFLHFAAYLNCLFHVLSSSHSLLDRSLSSLSCYGFGALLGVFRATMFTTSSKTTLN